MEIEGTCVSKNFDETVRLQSEKRQKWTREVRRERLQGIAEGASSAPCLASSSAASFPGRNECPGTHCSQIEQKERKDSSCQICHRVWDKRKDGGEDRVARTERESNRRRREEKWQTCWCYRDQQRACRMAQASAEKLEHTGPAEKGKSGLSATGRKKTFVAKPLYLLLQNLPPAGLLRHIETNSCLLNTADAAY